MNLVGDKYYTCNDIKELLQGCDYFIKSNKKILYCNIPFSFDIETSSFYKGDDKQACMYIWVMGINGKCIIGRTWKEFVDVLHKISFHFKLNVDKRVLIYVHNLAYEFQFIRNWFEWEQIFALDERKVVYARTNIGIEFRCSYQLSGYSLNVLARNLTKHKIQKMVGDLDYSLIRHSKTPITNEEMQYVLNDALIVNAYIDEEIEYNGDISKIPLTKTGYVRRYVRNECYKDRKNKKNKNKYLQYRERMKILSIKSVQEYLQLKRAFCGGFTHANFLASGKVVENVYSYDFTSSYPYVMVSEQFPISTGEVISIKSKEEFEKNLKLYCCIFDVTFYNLKSLLYEHPLSSSKCNIKGKYQTDNGRLVYAEEVTTTITEQDYAIFKKFYSWEHIKITRFRRYKKGYLPTDFVRAVLELYQKKTTLKGVKEKEVEYLKSKEQINSCYGMCVTDICREEVSYQDGVWSKQMGDIKELLEKNNLSKNRFIFYGWGIWVTAYARRNLFTAIYELGKDYIYSDTDSVKFINYEKHKEYFDNYNNRVILKLEKAMKFHNLPFELVSPKTIKGETKTLGLWDFDGYYKKFKTLGAKRYMVVYEDDELSLTCSGVNKKNAIPYLKQVYKTNDAILKAFDDDLKIPSEYISEVTKQKESATGKQTHTYIDNEVSGEVYDYLGNKGSYYEKSIIHLEPCDFSLSLSDEYLDYLLGYREVLK